MTSSTGSRVKLVIDCDPGTDDAQTILMALAHDQQVELMAVTTVQGNSCVENTTKNALRVLKFANRPEVPVYKGCSHSLIGNPTVHDNFHGEDGMGDVNLEGVDPMDLSSVRQESAPLALVNLANQYPGEVVLLAIGPLSNLGCAIGLDENIGQKFKDCVIMGGNLHGAGNITRTAEFNFFADPEAAQRVLQGWGSLITLVPLQTCVNHYIPWDTYTALMGGAQRTAGMLRAIDHCAISSARERELEGAEEGHGVWDQIALATILRPDCVLEARVLTAAVELSGAMTRGMMVVGRRQARDTWEGVVNNVRVITKIDDKIFHQLLSDTNNHEF